MICVGENDVLFLQFLKNKKKVVRVVTEMSNQFKFHKQLRCIIVRNIPPTLRTRVSVLSDYSTVPPLRIVLYGYSSECVTFHVSRYPSLPKVDLFNTLQNSFSTWNFVSTLDLSTRTLSSYLFVVICPFLLKRLFCSSFIHFPYNLLVV